MAKKQTEIKIRSGQNVTAMGWPKLQWVKSIGSQTVHFFRWTNDPSTLGWNVTIENCHRDEVSQWTKKFCKQIVRARLTRGRLVGGRKIKAPTPFYFCSGNIITVMLPSVFPSDNITKAIQR
jgi:hypothetical protein